MFENINEIPLLLWASVCSVSPWVYFSMREKNYNSGNTTLFSYLGFLTISVIEILGTQTITQTGIVLASFLITAQIINLYTEWHAAKVVPK
jgi:hypothetical protein